jgi:hypothetical protein
MPTIGSFVRSLEDVLNSLERTTLPSDFNVLKRLAPPPGYRTSIRLLRAGRRAIRADADESYWTPGDAYLELRYERDEPLKVVADRSADHTEPAPAPARPDAKHEVLARLIQALNKAEQGRLFVALKYFRDQFLPSHDPFWIDPRIRRQIVLQDAIEAGLLLTGKVENPKPPHFPVTTVRLNRSNGMVREILGAASGIGPSFYPVVIRGAPLSETILENRR